MRRATKLTLLILLAATGGCDWFGGGKKTPAAPKDTYGKAELPDLVTVPPSDLQVQMNGRQKQLLISSTVRNAGHGPLVMVGVDGKGYQVVMKPHYQDGKFKDWVPDHQFGPVTNMFFNPGESDIHFDGFSEYALLDTHLHVLRHKTAAKKISFCVIDFHQWKSGLEGEPTSGAFSCGNFQGIDVGYEDTYESSIPGQAIDITGVPDGTYYVYDAATRLLEETDKTNNAAMVEVELKGDKLTIKKKLDAAESAALASRLHEPFPPELPALPRDPADKNPIDVHPVDGPVTTATKNAVDQALSSNAPQYAPSDQTSGSPDGDSAPPRTPAQTRGLIGAIGH